MGRAVGGEQKNSDFFRVFARTETAITAMLQLSTFSLVRRNHIPTSIPFGPCLYLRLDHRFPNAPPENIQNHTKPEWNGKKRWYFDEACIIGSDHDKACPTHQIHYSPVVEHLTINPKCNGYQLFHWRNISQYVGVCNVPKTRAPFHHYISFSIFSFLLSEQKIALAPHKGWWSKRAEPLPDGGVKGEGKCTVI